MNKKYIMKNQTDINRPEKEYNWFLINKYTMQLVDADVAGGIRLPARHSVSYKHILANRKE